MVKPPKIRHSKSLREPPTIELGPDDVSRIDAPKASEPAEPEATSSQIDDAASAAGNETASETASEATPSEDRTIAFDEPPAPEAEAKAEPAEASQPAAGRSSDDENVNLMGSEWPPEPQSAEEVREEDRVPHAFGRAPDTPPPGARAGQVPPVSSKPAERKGMPAIAAGIVGGVITLLGAGGLQWAGLLPSPSPSFTAPADSGEAVESLKAEIAALRKDVETVKAGSGGSDTSALSQSVTELQGGVQGLTTALDQAKADIAALRDAIAQGSAGDGAAVQALNQKLTEVEASVAALQGAAAQGGAGDGTAVQDLNQKLAELQASVSALQQAGVSQPAIDAINQKLATVETAAAAASDAAKAGEGRLTALEQSVASLSEQVASQASQPKVALAIAAAALKSAVERGGTFIAEVETFAAIAPDSPELPALREIAAKGVASRAELVEGMDDAANAMIAASATIPEDAGFWDQLVASAESMVEVRPIGDVEGETVPAKVARMEVAVKAGDFTKALAEYDGLPEPSKVAGQAFATRIRDRVGAEELIGQALAGALNPA